MSQAATIREKHDGELADRSSVRLWLRLFSCTMAIEKVVQRNLAEQFGSTLPRFDVLAALARRPEGMAMGELSRALLVSNGNVTAIVKKLVADGLVSIAPLESDRRTSIVRLTAEGERHFGALADAHHDWVDVLLMDLDSKRREALYEELGALKLALGAATRKEKA